MREYIYRYRFVFMGVCVCVCMCGLSIVQGDNDLGILEERKFTGLIEAAHRYGLAGVMKRTLIALAHRERERERD